MIPAIIVLTLAWGISSVCSREQLDTAGYIISLIGDTVQPRFLPAIAFVAAGAMAVSIGSSFTTMGLMIPVFIPLSVAVLTASADTTIAHEPVFLATVGAILAGAIFGDHCSPISDTTVLTCLATRCDLMDHVTTQIPYALLAGITSLVICIVPTSHGLPWWLMLPLGFVVMVTAHRFMARPVDA